MGEGRPHFRIVAPFERAENRRQILDFFTSCKIRKRVGECLSHGFKCSKGPNLLYTFGAGPLRGLGDSTHFFRPFFRGGFVTPNSQSREGRPVSHLGGDRSIIGTPNVLFEFRYVASVRNCSASKAIIRPNFAILTACNITGRMSEIS